MVVRVIRRRHLGGGSGGGTAAASVLVGRQPNRFKGFSFSGG